jgi:hypothetical protein
MWDASAIAASHRPEQDIFAVAASPEASPDAPQPSTYNNEDDASPHHGDVSFADVDGHNDAYTGFNSNSTPRDAGDQQGVTGAGASAEVCDEKDDDADDVPIPSYPLDVAAHGMPHADSQLASTLPHAGGDLGSQRRRRGPKRDRHTRGIQGAHVTEAKVSLLTDLLLEMHTADDIQFIDVYNEATHQYLAGNWLEAKATYEMAQKLRPTDGPCGVMLDYMKEHDFVAPEDWRGFRRLQKK